MAAPDVPFLAASLLLAGAGAPKIMRPQGIVRAMRDAGLPTSDSMGRAIGIAELTIAVVAITVGGPGSAVALACAYLGFAGFLTFALLRGGLESCGCFGVDDSPPSWWHVLVNVVLGAVAIAATIGSVPTISTVADGTTAANIAIWLLAATAAWLIYLLLSLPQASTTRRHRPDLSTT